MGRRTSRLGVCVGSSPGLQGGSAQAGRLGMERRQRCWLSCDTAAGDRCPRSHRMPCRRFTPSAALVPPTRSRPQPHPLPLMPSTHWGASLCLPVGPLDPCAGCFMKQLALMHASVEYLKAPGVIPLPLVRRGHSLRTVFPRAWVCSPWPLGFQPLEVPENEGHMH